MNSLINLALIGASGVFGKKIISLMENKNVEINKNASINTESPAWAIDRLSILALKIFHMKEESERSSGSKEHRDSCKKKLLILMEQKNDLSEAIDQLLQDMNHVEE